MLKHICDITNSQFSFTFVFSNRNLFQENVSSYAGRQLEKKKDGSYPLPSFHKENYHKGFKFSCGIQKEKAISITYPLSKRFSWKLPILLVKTKLSF